MKFKEFADELIAAHSAELSIQQRIMSSFEALLPTSCTLNAIRKEKREFRDRFETFLNDVEGLLCLKY